MSYGPYPWAYPRLPNTSTPIAKQTESSYLDWKKTQQFDDVGWFLIAYVVQGGFVTKNIYSNNQIDISDTEFVLDNELQHRDAVIGKITLKNANSTYYVDIYQGDFWVNTSHPPGAAGNDYLALATVTTDVNGNVTTITDTAGMRGGFRLKSEYGLYGYLRGIINVLDFGVKADGVTDDTAAIQAAIDAVPSGSLIFFPPGTYILEGTVNVNRPVTIEGCSPALTVFKTKSSTADIFNITSWNVWVQNIGLDSSVVRTAGYGINHANGSGVTLYNIGLTNMWNGVNLSGILDVADLVTVREFRNNGIEINGGTDQKLTRILTDNGTAPAGSGILITQTGAVFLDNCDIIRSNIDLRISPPTAGTGGVYATYATNCYFDTATNGMVIDGAGPVERLKFTNCWFASHSSDGVILNNPNIKALDFVNCDFYGNGGDGISARFVNDWGVSESRIAQNAGSGINLSGNTPRFKVRGNVISPTGGWSGNNFAIWINPGNYEWYEISGNIVSGNNSGSIVDNGTVSTRKYISQNIGFNPVGLLTAPAIPASGDTVINTNGFSVRVFIFGGMVSTIWLNGVGSGVTSGMFILDPGEFISITYSAAPSWTWYGL
ncbi:glycosyl hydrolase family 28-related protein [Paenibacillus sp. GYB003]|uniref:glycosyl hydrolase family 28-related protein n=1 Tax=Paenibacillus sp. GYB003 TaxID=2994392 RepID=UPI002F96A504